MLAFDAHLDLAWNALDWNRDLRLSCAEIRQRETDAGMTDKGRCCNTVPIRECGVTWFIASSRWGPIRKRFCGGWRRKRKCPSAGPCC